MFLGFPWTNWRGGSGPVRREKRKPPVAGRGGERKMPMAYSGTRIPENPCGVKVPFRVLWRRSLATKKVTAYRRHLARRAREQRALDDFGRRLEAAHATQRDILALFVECRVRFHLISAPRPRATHTRTRTRAPRPRATRRTRRACRVEAPPGGDDSGGPGSDSDPPAQPRDFLPGLVSRFPELPSSWSPTPSGPEPVGLLAHGLTGGGR